MKLQISEPKNVLASQNKFTSVYIEYSAPTPSSRLPLPVRERLLKIICIISQFCASLHTSL